MVSNRLLAIPPYICTSGPQSLAWESPLLTVVESSWQDCVYQEVFLRRMYLTIYCSSTYIYEPNYIYYLLKVPQERIFFKAHSCENICLIGPLMKL